VVYRFGQAGRFGNGPVAERKSEQSADEKLHFGGKLLHSLFYPLVFFRLGVSRCAISRDASRTPPLLLLVRLWQTYSFCYGAPSTSSWQRAAECVAALVNTPIRRIRADPAKCQGAGMLDREASRTSNPIPALVVELAIDMTLRKPHIQLFIGLPVPVTPNWH
jgi:hypothetical protein